MSNVPLVFVDVESTGLDPDVHVPWEIALIRREPGISGADEEYVYRLDPEDRLVHADPNALRLTRYYERTTATDWSWSDPAQTARNVAEITAGAHLVGAVPGFDVSMLLPLLASHGLRHAWHYHLTDVENLAAGWLRGRASGAELAMMVLGAVPTDGTDEASALSQVAALAHRTARPSWDSEALSRAVGVDPAQFARHEALGDARWAKAIHDTIMEG